MERRGHGGTLQIQAQTGKEEGKRARFQGAEVSRGWGSSCGQGGGRGRRLAVTTEGAARLGASRKLQEAFGRAWPCLCSMMGGQLWLQGHHWDLDT